MAFELFDRDVVAAEARKDLPGPLVRVDTRGRLLFNGPAWQFLAMQIPPGAFCEVALLFDVAARTLAVRPITTDTPAGARWQAKQMRSTVWPRSVYAPSFLELHKVALGEHPAKLMRGASPRMMTCEVGPARLRQLPAGVVPFGDDPVDGDE